MSTQQEKQTEPLLLNISQVARLLGLSRTTVYTLIATEGLPVVRFGRVMRVLPTSLQEWLEHREKR